MILEFTPHNYVNVDNIQALRWFEKAERGFAVLDGERIALQTKEEFDVVEQAFIALHKSYMYDDKQKKIVWKRGTK